MMAAPATGMMQAARALHARVEAASSASSLDEAFDTVLTHKPVPGALGWPICGVCGRMLGGGENLALVWPCDPYKIVGEALLDVPDLEALLRCDDASRHRAIVLLGHVAAASAVVVAACTAAGFIILRTV